jgi:hypothetical protein
MMIGGMHQGLPCSKAMLVSSHLALVNHHTPFALAPLEFIKKIWGNKAQNGILSNLLQRSPKKESKEIYFTFVWILFYL